jgi:hypothetical protein
MNLHERGKEFEPKAQNVQVGSGDLCFLVEDKVDDVLKRLHKEGTEVLEGGQVVERTGARGKLRSVYIRDPDGNLVEWVSLVMPAGYTDGQAVELLVSLADVQTCVHPAPVTQSW